MDWHMNRTNELSVSQNAIGINVSDTIREKLQAGYWFLRSDGDKDKQSNAMLLNTVHLPIFRKFSRYLVYQLRNSFEASHIA
jgi:hypothetical protein